MPKTTQRENKKQHKPKSKKVPLPSTEDEYVPNEEKYLRIEPSKSFKVHNSINKYRLNAYLQKIKDKKLRTKLIKQDIQAREAAKAAARAEMLLHEDVGYLEAEGIENTHYYTQDKLKQAVDVNTASKVMLFNFFYEWINLVFIIDVFLRSTHIWSIQG